ncbi:cysteine--tRNA ligase [Methyloceanibacter superfactus]|uniref:Cysteine--tRNA ligase n=1 Tax=Methyloceanibacter superfactus TaxID=1774969 RepID=A0A1E3W1S9_9HYPH|nr:cysteine--tRNA ligase [Methyloceanibacter superfactus]ODR99730.1 cysteine--tRNA ligase [Methyloceanibacter superfactus]
MALTLYNTLSRKKEPFAPLDPAQVRMYVCGPTVYDYAHIGNARPVIVFDVLYRLLRHLYGPEHVTYVRNITDVDDKINARAAKDYPGLPLNEAIAQVTQKTADQFHADMDALGALPPTVEPRATEHIGEMRTMIDRLIANGCAYVAEDHVLFHVAAMPRLRAVVRASLDEMIAGARVEVAPFKRDPMDFVLWKPSKPGEPSWTSPGGIETPGRPGWHIECSAMAAAHLGEVFDIHGGGIDLVFPHHENEIAQSRCAHGSAVMAQVWMHNGFLQVEGEKMSKSLGNFVTVHELLTGWQGYAWPGEALRLNMLRTHYRQPLDWTFVGLDEAHKTLWEWYGAVEGSAAAPEAPASIIEALSDDLNTPKVIAELHKLHSAGHFEGLRAALGLLGFSGERARIERSRQDEAGSEAADADAVDALIAARSDARKAKNFAEADRIRGELEAMGIVLKDAKDPNTGELVTTWEAAR